VPETHVFLEVRTLTDTINELLEAHTQAIATQQRFIANAAINSALRWQALKLQAERALRETGFIRDETGTPANPKLC